MKISSCATSALHQSTVVPVCLLNTCLCERDVKLAQPCSFCRQNFLGEKKIHFQRAFFYTTQNDKLSLTNLASSSIPAVLATPRGTHAVDWITCVAVFTMTNVRTLQAKSTRWTSWEEKKSLHFQHEPDYSEATLLHTAGMPFNCSY